MPVLYHLVWSAYNFQYGSITAVAFSRDGKMVATAADRTVRLSTAEGRKLQQWFPRWDYNGHRRLGNFDSLPAGNVRTGASLSILTTAIFPDLSETAIRLTGSLTTFGGVQARCRPVRSCSRTCGTMPSYPGGSRRPGLPRYRALRRAEA
jgi:hypothetical protein